MLIWHVYLNNSTAFVYWLSLLAFDVSRHILFQSFRLRFSNFRHIQNQHGSLLELTETSIAALEQSHMKMSAEQSRLSNQHAIIAGGVQAAFSQLNRDKKKLSRTYRKLFALSLNITQQLGNSRGNRIYS